MEISRAVFPALLLAACAAEPVDEQPQTGDSCVEPHLDFFEASGDVAYASKARYGASTYDGSFQTETPWEDRIEGEVQLLMLPCSLNDDCGTAVTLSGRLFGLQVDNYGLYLDDWRWCARDGDRPMSFIGQLESPRAEIIQLELQAHPLLTELHGTVSAVAPDCHLDDACVGEPIGDIVLERLPFRP